MDKANRHGGDKMDIITVKSFVVDRNLHCRRTKVKQAGTDEQLQYLVAVPEQAQSFG